MEFRRIMPPPTHLMREFEVLFEAYCEQLVDDDDENATQEDDYGEYLRSHGSAELIKYLDEQPEYDEEE